jgi:hypothetical protein
MHQVALVPGNHDLIFDKQDPVERWAFYCAFERRFRARDVQPDAAHELSRIVDRSAEGLVIAEINSCFDVRKGSPDAIRGQVDEAVIARLRRELEAIPGSLNDSLKVALIHHHPVVLPALAESGRGYDAIVNSTMLLELLRDFGFHLVLHGHKHFPHTFSYDTQCAWTADPAQGVLVVSGGSAGAAHEALPGKMGAVNTYNAISLRWNPAAKHGRIRVMTRGLQTTDPKNRPMPAPNWHWRTLKVDDRLIGSRQHLPQPRARTRAHTQADLAAESLRTDPYRRLRGNMPVVEVMPSLDPNQAYEALLWIVPHEADGHRRVLPLRVEWLPGSRFPEVAVCERADDLAFAATVAYFAGMNVLVRLFFDDGEAVTHTLYARKP